MTLEGRRLAIGHGRHVIGRDIDIVLHPGEAVALLGPNGGGKTTLLKTLIGLIPAHDGEVTIGGRKLTRLSARERARLVAYVPQVHVGTFAFSVETVVLMGRTAHMPLFARPSPSDHDATRAALERLGIAGLAARPYTEISGGERQLVLLARALAQRPRFIVLDEPTANLDFGNQGKVIGEIRALAQTGLGVLFTTHDPNQALRIAARVYLMRHGRCVADGPVQDMLTRERLEAVYDAPIRVLSAAGGTAFLPA
ncbi:MAG: ABC transporter ATP-binding protein [Pseudolabrys sp.]|nr:ABC transporter ATP-binding protein [Pseudolabrys sp.]